MPQQPRVGIVCTLTGRRALSAGLLAPERLPWLERILRRAVESCPFSPACGNRGSLLVRAGLTVVGIPNTWRLLGMLGHPGLSLRAGVRFPRTSTLEASGFHRLALRCPCFLQGVLQQPHRGSPSTVCTKSRPELAPSPGAGSARAIGRSPERVTQSPAATHLPHMWRRGVYGVPAALQ
jgi:hypothetical protein